MLEQQIINFEERDDDMSGDKPTYTEALVRATTALEYVEKRLDNELARVVEDIGSIRTAIGSVDVKVQELAGLRLQNHTETKGVKEQIKRLWWAFGLIGTGLLALMGLVANLLR